MNADRIVLSGVSKSFRSREGEVVPAVEKVSFGVPAGAIVCLLGPTGCGKSTILRLVAGLEEPDSGRSELVRGGNGAEGLPAGFLTQRHTLFPWLTAEKNIGLPLEVGGSGRERAHAVSREIMETLELSRFAGLYPHEMSGGMQQRAALGRLLATGTDCWLLDEPFAALDERTRHAMQDLLVRLAGERGITVLFVTHSIDEAVRIADRMHLFSTAPGRIVESFELDDPRPRDRLSDTFGEYMERVRRRLEKEIG
jgi:NitT/TauT family transport system ATP-binding protein